MIASDGLRSWPRLIGLAAALLLWYSTTLTAAEEVLDGMVFVGQSGEVGGPAEVQDELSFNDGELYSSDCARWGFEAGEYETFKEGEQIRFRAITNSPDNGKIVWQGTVKGNLAEATFTWTKERWWWKDAEKHSWFKGQLKE